MRRLLRARSEKACGGTERGFVIAKSSDIALSFPVPVDAALIDLFRFLRCARQAAGARWFLPPRQRSACAAIARRLAVPRPSCGVRSIRLLIALRAQSTARASMSLAMAYSAISPFAFSVDGGGAVSSGFCTSSAAPGDLSVFWSSAGCTWFAHPVGDGVSATDAAVSKIRTRRSTS